MGLHKHATKRKLRFAKKLRRRLTRSERAFWSICQQLRKEKVFFWRQIVLCGYVADFWCPKLKIVVEIDGPSHLTEDSIRYDKYRADVMSKELGAKTIRFTNFDVLNRAAAVEYDFRRAIKKRRKEIS
jgi:very-short-patch-repair endonuclease